MTRHLFHFGRSLRRWFGSLAARLGRRRRLTVVRTDELPDTLSHRHLYVIGERGEDWYAAMVCPCGCEDTVELNLIPPGRPHWQLTEHRDRTPTLTPSIWRQVECRSHYWVRRGLVVWATDGEDGL
jgi:hypothetical protein